MKLLWRESVSHWSCDKERETEVNREEYREYEYEKKRRSTENDSEMERKGLQARMQSHKAILRSKAAIKKKKERWYTKRKNPSASSKGSGIVQPQQVLAVRTMWQPYIDRSHWPTSSGREQCTKANGLAKNWKQIQNLFKSYGRK